MFISDQVYLKLGDTFLVSLPATIAAIGALISAIRNGKKTEKVKEIVNGRMDQLLALAKETSHRQGQESVVKMINQDPELPNIELTNGEVIKK